MSASSLAVARAAEPKTLRVYQDPLVAAVVADLTPRPKKLLEVVLAACCGAGKTFMSIETAGDLLAAGAVRRVLVLAHGTTVLRSQYAAALAEASPEFAWATYVPRSKPGYVSLANLKAQLVVALPQSLASQDVSGFDLILVDEAHQFYGEKMVSDIVERSGAKRVLLLTGTPSPFVARGFGPDLHIHAITMQELYQAGTDAPDGPYVANAEVEVRQSKYNVRHSQYNEDGEIKRNVSFTKAQTEETLADLLKWWPKAKTWAQVFRLTGKAMIVCRSQKIAKRAAKYFSAAGVSVALSTCESDAGGKEIERFQEDTSVQLLIVVCRANLGFDFPQLGALIDMTGTINIDRIFQMFARVVRPNGAAPKLFVKLASADMHRYTRAILSASLQLQHRHVYLSWNGKNLNGIRIPDEQDPPGKGGGRPRKGLASLPPIDPRFFALGDFMQEKPHADGSLRSWTTLAAVAATLGQRVVNPGGRRERLLDWYREQDRAVPNGHELYDTQRAMRKAGVDREVIDEQRRVGYPTQARRLELVGRRFGSLLVIRKAKRTIDSGGSRWLCKCDCGNTKTALGTYLINGRAKSCRPCAAVRHPKYKLSAAKADDIRARYSQGTTQERLARQHKVSQNAISRVIGLRSWSSVAPAAARRRRRP